MSTLSYAIDALSPAAFVVWMRLAELSREGIPYSDDPEVLARVCRMTPKRFDKMQDEISAAGLDDVDPFAEQFTDCESRQQNLKRNSLSSAERMRRFRARKAAQSDATVTARDADVTSHVTRCDVTQTSLVTNSDAESDGDVTQRRGSSLSPKVSPAPLPNPNPILPREVNSSAPVCEGACEGPKLKITPAMLAGLPADPETIEPEIIPPDLSDIRSAVSGMLAGVAVPMSETPPESATTEVAHAENPSRSATPVPAGRASTSPAKPRRSPGISREIQSEFARFWDAYPRKVGGKPAALKAYAAARKVVGEATLLEAVKRYARSRAGEDPQYTCHPATWLNKGRWDDEIPSVPSGGDAGHSLIRPGKRASFDPVDDAYRAEMAEIAERERENHVH